METLVPFVKIGLYVLMALSVIAAVGVVTLTNIFYAALALVAVLVGIAAIFFALHADFLAIVQILLYVGAVMTLVIFAVMMTQKIGQASVRQHNRLALPGLAGALIFLFLIGKILWRTAWPVRPETLSNPMTLVDLGTAFLGPYVFPFEVISVILIVALIGAIMIAKKDKEA